MTAACLAVVVLAAWHATLGFLRLPTAFDRLHASAFITVAAGAALVVAVFVADGASTRVLKAVLIVALTLLGSAAGTHALGRAIEHRRSP